jgi:hypothetical protein
MNSRTAYFPAGVSFKKASLDELRALRKPITPAVYDQFTQSITFLGKKLKFPNSQPETLPEHEVWKAASPRTDLS